LASALSHAEQTERRRLAQVLHDQLQQVLMAARLKVGMLHRRAGDEGTHELLDALDEMLDQAIAESRFLTTKLCPPMLHEGGLAAALEWLAGQVQKRHGVSVTVEADRDRAPLDEETRTFLFHAARESLFNVVKHAQTDQAWVRVRETPDGMVGVEVLDKGVGCDPTRLDRRSSYCGGFGLFSIRARVEVLRGRCEVKTTPGQGTRVAIFVPGGKGSVASAER
jgi:signal transduction histidine kinase